MPVYVDESFFKLLESELLTEAGKNFFPVRQSTFHEFRIPTS
jgi:hypothetical protein